METTAFPLSHPWTQAVQLSCVICGAQAQPGPSWTGCKTCQGPAGLKLALTEGLADATGPAVCVLTSSGLNWTRDLDAAWGGVPHVLDSPAAVLSHAGLSYVAARAAAIAASATTAGSAGGTGPYGEGGASAGREVRLAEQGPPSAGTGAPPP